MPSTREWAAAHGLCVTDNVPAIDGYTQAIGRTPAKVASRVIVLHCVAAVGYKVNPEPIVEWLEDQELWNVTSKQEQALLLGRNTSQDALNAARWRSEAQWALLWAIKSVDSLGLPTKTCNTARLVDEIMPALGDPIEEFVSSAVLRSPSEILAEDDRIYNLHCYARKALRDTTAPDDLNYGVLFQRHYAFEWLTGDDDWDNVEIDT